MLVIQMTIVYIGTKKYLDVISDELYKYEKENIAKKRLRE